MARRHIPESHASHPNVTPLIDVVMVLIVFFMLVAKIGVNTGADEKIHVPPSIMGIKIQDMGNTLLLNVRAGPVDQPMVTALIPGTSVVAELQLRDSANQNQLVNTLKMLRYGKDMKPGGTGENIDNDNFQVVIRGDKDMEFRYLEPVLEACALANVKAINFNTSIDTEKSVASAQ